VKIPPFIGQNPLN